MKEFLIPIIISCIFVLPIVIFVIVRDISYKKTFSKDPFYNPYRRFCKKCGQSQSVEQSFNHSYWVNDYPIIDPYCSCHNWVSLEDREYVMNLRREIKNNRWQRGK